ncbi:MAG: SPOR domain-containing protein [bacterium]
MAQQIEDEGTGRRDYFWIKIIVGLVLVTVAALLISKLVVPMISGALGGKKTPAAITENGNLSVFEETGEKIKGLRKEEKPESGRQNTDKIEPQLTEEEAGGQQSASKATKTDVSIEKVETGAAPAAKEEAKKHEESEPVTIVTEKKAEQKKEPAPKKAEVKSVAEKKTEKEPAKVVAKPKPAAEAQPAPTASKPAAESKQAEKPGDVVYVLQLGNFTSQENADRMKKMLVDQYSLEVFIKKIQYEGQTRFRVQAGAFKDKANAQKLARELQVKGYNSYIAETAAGQ